MAIADIFQINKIKAELEQTRKERDALKSLVAETDRLSLHEIKQTILQLEERKCQVNQEIEDLQAEASREAQNLEASHAKKRQSLDQQIADLNRQIVEGKKDLIVLDDELLLQSFGFYKPRYGLENSELYKNRLEQIRERQAAMVKAGKAAICPANWSVNNSQKEGES